MKRILFFLVLVSSVAFGQNKVVIKAGSPAALYVDTTLSGAGTSASPLGVDTVNRIATKVNVAGKGDTTKTRQSGTYNIYKLGLTTYAVPAYASGLPYYSGSDSYTIIQNAVTALTPSGGQGTSGGTININKGSYSLSDEITITGWETSNPPFSQIIISGEGYSTRIIQNTASKNAFVAKNRASVVIKNMWIGVGASALSGILFNDNGAASEISVFKAIVDNVMIVSSGTAPAFYAKNFFALDVPNLWAENSANDGVKLENTTAIAINYGNSHFGQLNVKGSATSPFADLRLLSNIANHPINLITFDAVYSGQGYYGLFLKGAAYNTFSSVDVEYMNRAIWLEGGGSGVENYGNIFSSGLVYIPSGGTAIKCDLKSAGNKFTLTVNGDDGTVKPIVDSQAFRQGNEYNLLLGYSINAANIVIVTPNETFLKYTKASDGLSVFKAPTPATTDNSSNVATTAYVKSNLASLGGGSGGGDPLLTALAAMGSPYKAQSVGLNILEAQATAGMVDGNGKGQAVYLSSAQTITGISFILKTAGNFTADQENAIGLFTFNSATGGTTKVAQTANSDAFWKGTTGVTNVAFASPYAAAAGLYYVKFLYNSSAQTTAPALGGGITLGFTGQTLAGATNGGKLTFNMLGSFNALPTTYDLNGSQTANVPLWVALY